MHLMATTWEATKEVMHHLDLLQLILAHNSRFSLHNVQGINQKDKISKNELKITRCSNIKTLDIIRRLSKGCRSHQTWDIPNDHRIRVDHKVSMVDSGLHMNQNRRHITEDVAPWTWNTPVWKLMMNMKSQRGGSNKPLAANQINHQLILTKSSLSLKRHLVQSRQIRIHKHSR